MAKKVKPRDPEKYEYAYLLFMQNVMQKEICERVGISAPTLQKYIETGGWKEKRASRSISIDDIAQKALRKISEMLDNDDFSADAFAKAVSQLKTLKTKNTVDDDINAFMDFQDYLVKESANDNSITSDFIKEVVKHQDNYIQYRLGDGKKY